MLSLARSTSMQSNSSVGSPHPSTSPSNPPALAPQLSTQFSSSSTAASEPQTPSTRLGGHLAAVTIGSASSSGHASSWPAVDPSSADVTGSEGIPQSGGSTATGESSHLPPPPPAVHVAQSPGGGSTISGAISGGTTAFSSPDPSTSPASQAHLSPAHLTLGSAPLNLSMYSSGVPTT